ncbi:hypothetical protein GN956_G21564 [Arapaima gigas]
MRCDAKQDAMGLGSLCPGVEFKNKTTERETLLLQSFCLKGNRADALMLRRSRSCHTAPCHGPHGLPAAHVPQEKSGLRLGGRKTHVCGEHERPGRKSRFSLKPPTRAARMQMQRNVTSGDLKVPVELLGLEIPHVEKQRKSAPVRVQPATFSHSSHLFPAVPLHKPRRQ